MTTPTTVYFSSHSYSYLSLTVIVVGSVFYAFDIVVLAVALWHRRYAPIKAKNLPLLSAAVIASLLWWIGVLQANGILGYHGIWRHCLLWGVWVQFTFGIMLLNFTLFYRLYMLDRLILQHRRLNTHSRLLPCLIYWIPVLVVSVLATVPLEESMGAVRMMRVKVTGISINDAEVKKHAADLGWNEEDICLFREWAKSTMILMTTLGFLVLMWFWFRLRRVNITVFNEYRETRIGVCLACLNITVTGVVIFANLSTWYWVCLTVVILHLITGNLYIWLVILPPVYRCLTNRQAHLSKFREGLKLRLDMSPKYEVMPGMPSPAGRLYIEEMLGRTSAWPVSPLPPPVMVVSSKRRWESEATLMDVESGKNCSNLTKMPSTILSKVSLDKGNEKGPKSHLGSKKEERREKG